MVVAVFFVYVDSRERFCTRYIFEKMLANRSPRVSDRTASFSTCESERETSKDHHGIETGLVHPSHMHRTVR